MPSVATNPNGNGRLSAKTINTVWNEVCRTAGVEGKTPHRKDRQHSSRAAAVGTPERRLLHAVCEDYGGGTQKRHK